MAGVTTTAPFRLGAKQVFLPNFTITMLNSPLPSNFAKFIVPLNMNKLDLRDYLYHAYNVRVVSVRSYVHQQKIVQSKPNAPKFTIKRWSRPRAIKKMTVELESPFVWPKAPESLKEWSKDTFDQAQKDNDKYRERSGRLADAKYDAEDRESIAEQARRLIEGKEAWRPADELGRARRV